ncbi:hypothetical protein C3E98_019070 [Pseudomonas sp. MWU13-2625]|nr:hypothetical protein C3E98_019070 [Pseudomonas sp. MWU13-2625]
MALQKINLGAAANDGTGDALRTGGQKINENFDLLDERTLNANLQALAGLSGQANRVPYFTGSGALSLAVLTALGRQLIAITQPSEGRDILGLGSAAVVGLGVASGAASLGPDGKVPAAQLPVAAIGNVFVVSSEAAMLALSAAVRGDIAVRTDLPGTSYILTQTPASVLANWALYNQALSPALSALNVLTPAADRIPIFTSDTTAALLALSVSGRSVVTGTAQDGRTALGLKTGAVADVVGTMSGGAIIEDISNANGRCVRFANGFQVCTLRRFVTVSFTDALAAMFSHPGELFLPAAYPAPFVEVPAIGYDYSQAGWYGFLTESTLPSATAWPGLKGLSLAAVNGVGVNFSITATGRWKA